MSNAYTQEHYQVVRIALPSVSGECTLSGNPGFSTPLTCDQPANDTTVYSFISESAPLIADSPVYRYLKSISETVTKLEPRKGLASRGSASVVLTDFVGDPNIDSPALVADPDIESSGTFLGKLNARNLLVNKEITIELYTVADGVDQYPNPEQTRRYFIESFNNNGKGTWTIKCKDLLASINFDEFQYPPAPENARLRQDIDDTVTTIPVDADTTYAVGQIVLIADEFMKITAVSNIGNSSATITVQQRGTDIFGSGGKFLTKTETDSHSAGDTIFICLISDNQRIDDWLVEFFTLAQIPTEVINNSSPDWLTEVNDWHPDTRINTLWYKPEDANEVLEQVLTSYMMDLWYEPTTGLIRLTAVSEWRDSDLVIEDGKGITFNSFKATADEELRATRSLAIYDKRFLSRSDDLENYDNIALFTDTKLEGEAFFGKPKDHRYDPSRLLDDVSAQLLVQRRVRRFALSPIKYNWQCEERFLNYKTGDVAELRTPELQGFDGATKTNVRAQVLSVQPKYDSPGRIYNISALTYAAATIKGNTGEIVRENVNLSEINLYVLANAPNEAVNLTFVFDNCFISSNTKTTPAIRAGSFPAGSVITVILVGGTDWQCKGGDGGRGGGSLFDFESSRWRPDSTVDQIKGGDGGICYADEGIQTNIYLSGTTPSANYPNADGFLRAGGGGGAGQPSAAPSPFKPAKGGDGGGGGAGSLVGIGGSGGVLVDGFGNIIGPNGDAGQNGTITGTAGLGNTNGGGWGQDGETFGVAVGGKAGKGISGGSTFVSGGTPKRFINGSGDAPASGAFATSFGGGFS